MDAIVLYFVFFIVMALGFIEQRALLIDRRVIRYFAIIIFVFVSAIRAPGFGSDDVAYMDIFQRASSSNWLNKEWLGYSYIDYQVEFSFFIFLLSLSLVGVYSFLLFGATSAFSFCFIQKAAMKFFPLLSPVLLIYFSHHFLGKELNALRLAIAAAIVFYSASCCVEQKYVKASMFTIFAATFQITSLLGLFPILMCALIRRIQVAVILGVGIVALSYFYPISPVLSQISLFDFASEKLELYSAAESYMYAISLFDPVNVKNIVLVIICLATYRRISLKYSGFHVATYFFLFATVFRIALSDFAIVAGRGFAIVSVFECVLLPAIAFNYFGRSYGYLVVLIYAFLVLTANIFINDGWRGEIGFFG